jgi:hypothetical protein
MGKYGFPVEIVRARTAFDRVDIRSRGDQRRAVIVLHHHPVDAADDQRSIVVTNDHAAMMTFDPRYVEVGG